MATQDVSIWSESDSPKVAVVDKDATLPAEGSAVVLMGAVEGTTVRALKINSSGELVVTADSGGGGGLVPGDNVDSWVHDGVGNPIPSTLEDTVRGLNVYTIGGTIESTGFNSQPTNPDDISKVYDTAVSGSTGTRVVIGSYTVPTGKNFNLLMYRIAPTENPSKNHRAEIRINGSTKDSKFIKSATDTELFWSTPIPVIYAGPGDLIELTITKISNGSTSEFSATLNGYDSDVPD
jgi:hypothetical protein